MPQTRQPISRNLELEALREAVRWPNPSPRTVLALAGQLLAARQHDQGRALFAERAEQVPAQPLYAALAGFFQALAGSDLDHALDLLDRAVDQAPGVANYLRGLILAQLPAGFGQAEAAVADLELVLALPEWAGFPSGCGVPSTPPSPRRTLRWAAATTPGRHGTVPGQRQPTPTIQRW
jgi:hypothetical protein